MVNIGVGFCALAARRRLGFAGVGVGAVSIWTSDDCAGGGDGGGVDGVDGGVCAVSSVETIGFTDFAWTGLRRFFWAATRRRGWGRAPSGAGADTAFRKVITVLDGTKAAGGFRR
jgi:hypothetical protein